jgi:hypothetical protein
MDGDLQLGRESTSPWARETHNCSQTQGRIHEVLWVRAKDFFFFFKKNGY